MESVKPPMKNRSAGASMPMNRALPEISSAAVLDTPKYGLKFVRLESQTYIGKYMLILFMDNRLTDPEIDEWKKFSASMNTFKENNTVLLGVSTASHFATRAFMMNRMKGIKFPVISDINGEISRSFGTLDIDKKSASRAVAVVSPDYKLVYLKIKNESTFSNPEAMVDLLRHLQGKKIVHTKLGTTTSGPVKSADQPATSTSGTVKPTDHPATYTSGSVKSADKPATNTTGSVKPADQPGNTASGPMKTADSPRTAPSASVKTADNPRTTTSGSVKTADNPRTTNSGSLKSADKPSTNTTGSVKSADQHATTASVKSAYHCGCPKCKSGMQSADCCCCNSRYSCQTDDNK